MSLNLNKTDQELEQEYQEAVINNQKSGVRIGTVLIIGFFTLLAGVPAIIGYFAYQSYTSHIRLNNGLKTEAILDNKYTEIRSRTGTRFDVSYSFTVNGKSYSGSCDISEKPSSKKAIVLYDPENPNNNKLEGGQDFFESMGQTVVLALVFGIIANLFVWGLKLAGNFSFRKSTRQKNSTTSKNPSAQSGKTEIPKPSDKFQISSNSILWIEKELLKLNREMWGEERPPHDLQFLQSFPETLLKKDNLSKSDVAEVAKILVNEIRKRINKLEVPFRKPRVEFTSLLPNNEPGHIEFGEYETVIRIHPDYTDNPFALASILCHEISHFVLDHNGLRKDDRNENEKLTDLFIFVCGQGLIHLQGIFDIISENGQTVESRLGYLSLEEMAYAHVRCSAQHGLSFSKTAPDYFSGKVFEEVKKAIDFLKIKNSKSTSLAEIILCPNNHILRISMERKSQLIRCPKCKWEKEIWLYKSDQMNYLLDKGIKEYDSGNFIQSLEIFRKAQTIDKSNSMAYCWASRCLKKLGKKQDAVRELQKLLSFHPDDQIVQDEMKTLIYD